MSARILIPGAIAIAASAVGEAMLQADARGQRAVLTVSTNALQKTQDSVDAALVSRVARVIGPTWDVTQVPPIQVFVESAKTSTGAREERYIIHDGHHRWAAAKQLGLPTVPVLNFAAMSQAERGAYTRRLRAYRKRIAHPLGRRVDGFDFFGDDDWTAGAPTPARKTPQEEALAAARHFVTARLSGVWANLPHSPALVSLQGILKPAGLAKAKEADNTGAYIWSPQYAWYLWSDQKSRKAAERWGRGILRQMVSKRGLHYSTPGLHDKTFVVGYYESNKHGTIAPIVAPDGRG